MLFHVHASTSLWFDAFVRTLYVINTLPSLVLHGSSPFQLLFGYAPNYANFKPFGCRVFRLDYATIKLEPRSRPCIFLGYSSIYKGFRCFDYVSYQVVFTTRHAYFDEQCFSVLKNSGTHVR